VLLFRIQLDDGVHSGLGTQAELRNSASVSIADPYFFGFLISPLSDERKIKLRNG
jgi:hypothetical protein